MVVFDSDVTETELIALINWAAVGLMTTPSELTCDESNCTKPFTRTTYEMRTQEDLQNTPKKNILKMYDFYCDAVCNGELCKSTKLINKTSCKWSNCRSIIREHFIWKKNQRIIIVT